VTARTVANHDWSVQAPMRLTTSVVDAVRGNRVVLHAGGGAGGGAQLAATAITASAATATSRLRRVVDLGVRRVRGARGWLPPAGEWSVMGASEDVSGGLGEGTNVHLAPTYASPTYASATCASPPRVSRYCGRVAVNDTVPGEQLRSADEPPEIR
jgi:hypothetical protein